MPANGRWDLIRRLKVNYGDVGFRVILNMVVRTKIQSQQNSNFGLPALCPAFLSVTVTLPQLYKLARTQTDAKITVT